ncbi:hypothetical protein [Chitinophaga sp. LS1]|uniref:hypothetical protein n=1 Tax=Chitinophaga sp. LS1 TaxID=3051176 RepID=UPI002AAAEAEA|nr:hypothetical protein [Chitinophaga sp. LS1]WPV65483.1 hypothetical protein QQL36_27150 [Chitinophaga sp. LS1]
MDDNEKKFDKFTALQQQIYAGPDAYKHSILCDCCSIFANKWNLLVVVIENFPDEIIEIHTESYWRETFLG